MDGPNPLSAAWSMLRSRLVRRPNPRGADTVDHSAHDEILRGLATGGIAALSEDSIRRYSDALATVDPDRLAHGEALAYWINLYNALALDLARRSNGLESVLRTRGGFTTPVIEVAGERLSLDAIEHGKIRRFEDPRVHAALVCGSASCPTLRHAAYTGVGIDEQLDGQMRHFLAAGAARLTDDRMYLSRVFLWYGADFVRPGRMPTLLPASRRAILDAITPWLGPDTRQIIEQQRPAIEFQEYDWSLRCSVRPPGP